MKNSQSSHPLVMLLGEGGAVAVFVVVIFPKFNRFYCFLI